MNKNYINEELAIERYQQGIRLVKPESSSHALCRVGEILNLPIPAFFYDRDSNFIGSNELCAEVVAAESARDMLGKTPAAFCSREFSDYIIAVDDAVVETASTKIVEEIGFRADDVLLQCLSVKLPLYIDDNIAGLLGFSIHIDNYCSGKFSNSMSILLGTGILGGAPINHKLAHYDKFNFSKREKEVLSHLVRGRTARQIAEIMQLSRRTIEHHIDHLKTKSGCASKSELIDKFYGLFS